MLNTQKQEINLKLKGNNIYLILESVLYAQRIKTQYC